MGITTVNFSSYQEAMAFLFQAVDFEKLTKYKYNIPNFNLDRMERLLASVGNPHKGLKAVHIAGTKGKGSTAIMIAFILKELGLRTGLFTSPHLVHLEERISINGEMIPQGEVCRLLSELRPYIEEERRVNPELSPTFFEIITALAFLYFRRKEVDIAILEVGMGGRLDSTNVVHPNVSVITNIGFDHTDKLGTTLSQIAFEKAGIIKEGIPVVSSEQHPEALSVIERTCKEKNSALQILGRDIKILNSSPLMMDAFNGIKCNIKTHAHSYKNLFLPLLGEHQLSNCAIALGAIDVLSEQGLLKIHEGRVRHALTTVRCPARVEVVSRNPLIILDAAHTVESIKALKQALRSNFKFNKLIVLMGISKDKDIDGILAEIIPSADIIIFTCSDSPRAAEPDKLMEKAKQFSDNKHYLSITNIKKALDKARKITTPDDLLCITGSFYVAGKVKEIMEGLELVTK